MSCRARKPLAAEKCSVTEFAIHIHNRDSHFILNRDSYFITSVQAMVPVLPLARTYAGKSC